MLATGVFLVVEPQQYHKDQQIEECLIDLRGVHRGGFTCPTEHKTPGEIGRAAIDFRVHQVAKPYTCATHSHGYHNAVGSPPEGHFVAPCEECQAEQKADGGTVAGHTALTDVEDAEWVCEVDFGLIEKAVAKPCTGNTEQGGIPKHRVYKPLGQFLALGEVGEVVDSGNEGQRPQHTIVAYFESENREECGVHIPHNR